MPPFVRDQALTGEVLAHLACLPDEGKVRAKTIEAAVLLLAHDAIVEIDTVDGRGYATVEPADQLAARTGISEKRLREALRHLCAVGLFTKTAGVSLGDTAGSEPDWYWLRTIPGAYVPDAQPVRFAPGQNGRVHLSTGAFASSQNDQMQSGAPLTDQRNSVDIEQPKRPDVVVCSTPPSHSVKNNTTTTHSVEAAVSTVANLDSYRPVTWSDGSLIEDEPLREALMLAGFKGRLVPEVEAAFRAAGPHSVQYLALQTSRGKGPGWMVKALKASGPAAIWDAFPAAPGGAATSDVTEVDVGPRMWVTAHCGVCDALSRRYIDPDDPQRIQRRCPHCHDDLLDEIQQRRAAIHAASTQPPARVVGENPF